MRLAAVRRVQTIHGCCSERTIGRSLDCVASTGEGRADTPLCVVIENCLDCGVDSWSGDESSDDDEEAVQCRLCLAKERLALPELTLLNLEVGESPEDEAEPAVEQGGHEGDQSAKEWDGLTNDPSEGPQCEYDRDPAGPTYESVAGIMACATEYASEDHLGGGTRRRYWSG